MVDHPTEEQFVEYFHKKKFGKLKEREKEFICLLNDGICLEDNCIIECFDKTEYVAPNDKYKSIVGKKKQKPRRDVEIIFEKKIKKVSLKSGKGNSSYQTCWTKFKKLLEIFNATKEEIDAFSNFVHSRDKNYFKKNGKECTKHNFKKNNPEFNNDHTNERKLMQGFLDRNEKQLLEHVLKEGYCSKEAWAEYIFHGDKNKILSNIRFEKMDVLIDSIIKSNKNKGNAGLYLKILTFQRWNVCPENKNKLNSVQTKIGSILEFLK